ncbi:chemotaxis protein CheD [Domibacillus enclensis]|uniref:Probable chemoreceptor glutamine deamidase CheD n=1 Tax=Domibacillus enclensis TaxID=1017273 RepID=A0A1N6UN30_9BACI|nr:chemotaxis protein CheD [Domibacillus enclensis]OXS78572.1 chemotaxis protein CheD [Domibacillus enclensis]SIQ67010.1 chemotaxis protein CheD [Domibacillus enclensis]
MNRTGQVVKVGIADLNVVKPPSVIRTSGLGSCVGVILYDESAKVAGLVHIMLPDSSLAKADIRNDAKFADTGIPALIHALQNHGARPVRLKAKIAGGAQMFQFKSGSDLMKIGPRNVTAVKEQLKKARIPVIAEDTGGSSGRTIEFDPSTIELHIRTVNKGEQIM